MPSRRRLSLVNGRHTFRSRLKRALSLSSSESSNETRNQRPRVNHNAEHEPSFENNEAAGDRIIGIEADSREGHSWRHCEIQSENEINRPKVPYQTEDPAEYSMVALKCVSELDGRVKSLAHSVSHQDASNETIRRDLADVLSRLATMETRMKDMMDRKETVVSKKNQPMERLPRR